MNDSPCRIVMLLSDETIAHCKLHDGHAGIHEAHAARGMRGPELIHHTVPAGEKFVIRRTGSS